MTRSPCTGILTQRQVALLSEKAPPTTGPRMAPTPHARPIKALYREASELVVKTDMYVKAPTYIPLPPIPAITRPTIRAFEVGAAPHSALPASKTTRLARIKVLISNNPYALPKNRITATDAMGNPRPTHGKF